MIEAFCPGHISCIFQPSKGASIADTGSRGVGIRLGLGARAAVSEVDGDKISISIDGIESEAPVTRAVAGILAPGKGFDISVRNDLPVSQGFGMSAAGAIAAAVCIAEIAGKSREEAYMAAHEADISGGGGMGDVAAIASGYSYPVRKIPGMPAEGKVSGAGMDLGKISVGVVGPKMVTGSVLSDPDRSAAIIAAAESAMEGFLADPSQANLFRFSNEFSSGTGLESREMSEAMGCLRSMGFAAGMCMLGNSLFTTAPPRVLRRILGPGAFVASCRPYSGEIAIVRRE